MRRANDRICTSVDLHKLELKAKKFTKQMIFDIFHTIFAFM